jgi:hypothetical protein
VSFEGAQSRGHATNWLLCASMWLVVFGTPAQSTALEGNVNLVPGLNLIGVPVDTNVTPDIGTLLETLGDASTIAELLRLNPNSGLFERCMFDAADNPVGAACSAPVAPGEGWLVEALTPVNIDYFLELACPPLDLRAGVNVVALPCAAEGLSAHGLLQALGDDSVAGNIQALDPATARWRTTVYEEGVPAGPNFPILPDQGYLIGLQQAVILRPPLANAGPDQNVDVGDTVQLDGSGSSDPDGDPLGFDWSFVSRPDNSAAMLSDTTVVVPSFTPDLLGNYEMQLIVNDGTFASSPRALTITAD